MKFIYYFQNKKIQSALERYILYVIKPDSEKFNKSNKHNVFLIEKNYAIDEHFLTSLKNIPKSDIIIFGNSGISAVNYVNLLDFANLKKNIVSVLLNSDVVLSPLLYMPEMKIKLSLFFKGHGEISLLNSLNWTRYYLSNGPVLFCNEKMNWEEYKSAYLNPGLGYWNTFLEKVNKYELYLAATGFENEITSLKEFADNFNKFVTILESCTEKNINEFNGLRFKKNIDNLKQIDYILENIRKKLKHLYHDI